MPTPAGVGILPVNLDEQTRDVVVQVVREVAPKMEVLEEQQACKTPETMRDYTEQTVTSDTSRSVKTKLSSSVDSSGSISWLDNFTSLEFSRDRRTGEGNDRSTSIESKSLFQSESLLKSDEVSPSTPNDLSGFAKVLEEFGTPPNAGVEWQLVATMPGSCPQFSLSQMIIVFPMEGTSGGSGVFPLEVSSSTGREASWRGTSFGGWCRGPLRSRSERRWRRPRHLSNMRCPPALGVSALPMQSRR